MKISSLRPGQLILWKIYPYQLLEFVISVNVCLNSISYTYIRVDEKNTIIRHESAFDKDEDVNQLFIL